MTITDPPVPAPIPPYVPSYEPYTQITPFTYRDGVTFLQKFESFQSYINDVIVPFINDNFALLGDEFANQVNLLIQTVNDALAAQDADVDQKIQDMIDYVDQAVADMIAGGINTSDPVMHGVLINPTSLSRQDVFNIAGLAQGVTYVIPTGSTVAQAQAILTAAIAGSTVVFQPGTYVLGATSFTVANDNITIDSRRATIQSSTWGLPVFDLINRSGIIIRAGIVQYTGVRGAATGTTFRGSALYVSTCAVYINRDNCRVESLHSIGMVTGIYFAAWDGTTVNDRYSKNNFAGAIEVEQYNFGVLWVMQQGLEINGGYFHDNLDDSAGVNPNHAVYGSSTTGARDTVVLLQNLRCENNLVGQAYQVKYCDYLNVRNLRAKNCAGSFNIIDSNDMYINGLVSLNDLCNTSVGSFSIQSTNVVSARPRIGNVQISTVDGANFHAFQAICNDAIINNISIDVGYNVGSYSAGLSIYDIRGDRNRLINISGRSRLNACCNGLVLNLVNSSAQGTIIEHPVFKNVAYGIFLAAASLDTAVEYNENLQSYVTGMFSVGAGATYSSTPMQSAATALSTLGEHATLNYLAKDSPTHYGANGGVQVKVRPTRDITVTNLYWWSVVASGNYDIGVYDDTLNTPLFTKGSTPFPAAGLITETIATPFVMKAGRTYRIAFAADNIVCSYRGVTGPITGMDKLLAGGNNVTVVAAIFPLPTTTLVAGASTATSLPLITVAGTKANVN